MTGEAPSVVRVLLVEDNPGDVRLIREALADSRLDVELEVVTDGTEALDQLRRRSASAGPLPDLVLLDLDLPGRHGRDVLSEMKGDLLLRRIPVCIVTSSADESDIQASYDEHANAYVTKPMELDRFLDVVQQIERFWLSVAALPRLAAPGTG